MHPPTPVDLGKSLEHLSKHFALAQNAVAAEAHKVIVTV